MNRHSVLSLPLLALGLCILGTGCTSAGRRAPTATPDTADGPVVYSVRGPFEPWDIVAVPGAPNPLCVPHYVSLSWDGGAGSGKYTIRFVFHYASKEWDRDRLAVTISAYDLHGKVLVTETQQTEDLRSRTPTGPVWYTSVAIYQSSQNQVQISANGSIEDVAQVVIKVAPY